MRQHRAKGQARITGKLGALSVPLDLTTELRKEWKARSKTTHVGATERIFASGELFAEGLPTIQVPAIGIAELAVTRPAYALWRIHSNENASPVIVTVRGGNARRPRVTTTNAYTQETFATALEVEITRRTVAWKASAVAEPFAPDRAVTLAL